MPRSSRTPTLLFPNSDTGWETNAHSTPPPRFLFFLSFSEDV